MEQAVDDDLQAKARRFHDLHHGDGAFIMPNAWNAGSARILAAGGFEALGTTSAGVTYGRGVPEYEYRVPGEEMLEAFGHIAAAVDVPVNGDLEAGYGDSPEAVAETIRQSVAHGMVGGGIEDHTGDPASPLYDAEHAADRIRAARAAADDTGIPYTLTARAECYLVSHPDPFAESVRRLNLYREAGADCLYAPGTKDKDTIAALVREVDGPVNVVMGLAGVALSARELEDLGVKRISIGGSLARAAMAVVRDAAREMAEAGTFTFAADAIPDAQLSEIFRRYETPDS
ncbi:MAG: isocitrate lyase/phosphoenolpyruvate mutase family protein [Alphaproteobacteria bacterium]|nr:isocitrate lyase/phosphoenolpyruvate mutase family protein [Alphaproteobacteria bacterium]